MKRLNIRNVNFGGMFDKEEYLSLCKEIAQVEVMSFLGFSIDVKRLKQTVISKSIGGAILLTIKTMILNV